MPISFKLKIIYILNQQKKEQIYFLNLFGVEHIANSNEVVVNRHNKQNLDNLSLNISYILLTIRFFSTSHLNTVQCSYRCPFCS